jgi:hypothetical protein
MTKTTGISKYLWLGIIVIVTSLVTVGSAITIEKAYAGDYTDQGNSGANSCGNEFLPTNVLCSNSGSQVQGDENAVAITSLQEAASSLIDGIVDGFLTIKTAIVEPFSEPMPWLDAFLTTHGIIPENGEGGAFGYGLLTAWGDSITVTTTHAGVLDSETQGGDANNPIWHNHFVQFEKLCF